MTSFPFLSYNFSARLYRKAKIFHPISPSRENGAPECPQTLRCSEIINILSAIDAQSATTTTAASGGNREELLGQRPARRACRPRHDADAGCRNPIAAGIQNRFTCPPAAPPARLSGRGGGSLPRQRSRPRAARTGRWRSPRPGERADSAAPARPAWRFPADGL